VFLLWSLKILDAAKECLNARRRDKKSDNGRLWGEKSVDPTERMAVIEHSRRERIARTVKERLTGELGAPLGTVSKRATNDRTTGGLEAKGNTI
jgi:hypothetical protein